MTRSPRLLTALGLLLLIAVPAVHAAAPARPNILLAIADDQTWTDVGCYGNPDVKTPNIDRLATDGMRFTLAFTATAMCSPTRQQLYTGLYPVRNGAYPNHSKVKPGTRSIVHHLRDMGYRVALANKTHIGPKESFPFERLGGLGNFDKIKEFINRDKNQPYCLVVASNSPHLPWSAGDASVYDPAKLKLPPYLVDTPKTRDGLALYYAEITDFDRELGECMKLVAESGSEDNTIVIYTSEQGSNFAHCKWTCYDTGLHTAMVIRWPGHIKAGAVSDAMVHYVDVVPTLIEAAGGDPDTTDVANPRAGDGHTGFDGESFLPVLLGNAKAHRDHVFGVHTTRGIANGSECWPIRSIRTRTHKFIWNPKYDTPFENIVTHGRAKSEFWETWVEKAKTDDKAAFLVDIYQHRPEFELYDLRDDPYELKNLAADPAHKELIKSLNAKLRAWMKLQGDKGIETEMAARGRKKK